MSDGLMRPPQLDLTTSTTLKIAAWHVETGLVAGIAGHYKGAPDEGRTRVAAALRSAGHLAVRGGELRVTLSPQSTPARTRAIAALCQLLDQTETVFPGTSLRMRFNVDTAAQWPPDP